MQHINFWLENALARKNLKSRFRPNGRPRFLEFVLKCVTLKVGTKDAAVSSQSSNSLTPSHDHTMEDLRGRGWTGIHHFACHVFELSY